MTKSHRALLAALTATTLVVAAATTAHAQAFTNGSFELGSTTGSVGNSTASTGLLGTGLGNTFNTTAVTGWTTTLGGSTTPGIFRSNNTTSAWVPNAQAGTYCLQLDGSSAASDAKFLTGAKTTASQTFYANAGSYSFSFYMSGEVGASKTGTVGALVSLSGVATGALTNQEYTIANTNTTAGSWTKETFNFTVTNPNTAITLTFADDNSSASLANYTASSNVAIDNVVLTQVPEPTTMLGGALAAGAFGWTLVRRRRTV